MSRGASDEAKNAANAGLAQNTSLSNTAKGELSPLQASLSADVNTPTGYNPSELGAINTASQQSLGGSVGTAVGAGNLQAERTHNSGSEAPMEDEAIRSAQQQLSQNALGIQGKNADLAQSKRQAALGAQQALYGKNTDASLNALGIVPGAVNAQTSADNQTLNSWLSPIQTALSPFSITKSI